MIMTEEAATDRETEVPVEDANSTFDKDLESVGVVVVDLKRPLGMRVVRV